MLILRSPITRTRSRTRRGGSSLLAALGLCLLLAPTLLPSPARAYETDQYSNRLVPIADSREELNALVNEALARVIEHWHGGLDRERFAREVYWELGGIYWVDKIERQAMKSPEIEKLPQRRHRSIFHGAPPWATRVNYFFGVGRTLKVAGVLVGSDKLGHFFSQGNKYYGSYLAGASPEKVAGRGRFNERWLFGQLTTGVYSNADLVANYEGFLFYRSLFEADVIPGKGPIVAQEGTRVVLLRPFDWADHINDYWDEALNPSYFDAPLRHWMEKALPRLCPDYEQDPSAYVPAADAELAHRYEHLGMKPAPQYRLDQVCGPASRR